MDLKIVVFLCSNLYVQEYLGRFWNWNLMVTKSVPPCSNFTKECSFKGALLHWCIYTIPIPFALLSNMLSMYFSFSACKPCYWIVPKITCFLSFVSYFSKNFILSFCSFYLNYRQRKQRKPKNIKCCRMVKVK